MNNLSWLVLFICFLGLEVAALLYRRDKLEPATYWIRKVLHVSPFVWLALLAFWLWLGYHFFVEA